MLGFMGSRKGPSTHEILSPSKYASRAQSRIQRKLEGAAAKGVAEAAFKAVAENDTTVGALYFAYKVAKFTYPIAKKGVEEYDKTGNKEKAIDKMKSETVKQVGKEIRGTAVETVVGAAINGVKDAANIVIEKPVDMFIKTAVSETINEMIE